MGSVKEIFFLLLAAFFVVSDCSIETTTADRYIEHGGLNAGDADSTNHDANQTHQVQRYKIAEFDFHTVAQPFVISIWIVVASAAKIGFHLNNKLSSWFPESCLLILVGVILGVILWAADVTRIVLDSHTFFLYLLPPIILDAGYFMPNRALFDNIGTILLFSVIGTLLNTLLIGFSLWGFSKSGGIGAFDLDLDLLHCLVFSSLLSAVDPVAVLAIFEEVQVNEILHIVVFGESLLNDGVTVVLYHLFEGLSHIGQENVIVLDVVYGVLSFFVVVGGGTAIGVLFGFLTALVTRFTDHVRVIEPLVVFVMGYLSYLTAEMFHLSGILSCTFCAITMKKYVEANISQKSHTTIKYFLKMLASVSETIIFMVLGISTVYATHRWETGFCLMSLIFCLVYRAAVVVFLTAIANRFRLVRLSGVDQFIIAYGGLRGAIAFSLVALLDIGLFPFQPLFLTSTLLVIYFTVFVQGTTIKPLVGLFRIKRANKHKPTMNEQLHSRMIDHLMAGMEDIAGHHGNHNQRLLFENFNARYLKPMLIKRRNLRARGLSILNVYQKLNEKDAREMLSNGSFADLTQLQNMSHSMADHLHYNNLQ
ncbi:hypothetical protein CAPTEDRAFT_97875 [Capitella teleta]|uniref:Sodium/hydrogen exchanger n=1 Tax=Capitella teleta TaxID=283909 RepID=R7T3U5_CAPTE|nr:hypothetical protein CAPTEDRAFT_97875 [Capitella teleta]|eukprot:ELT87433.1 hypothetical protein CAPTEDRAFT_97875 [Capitella teleta]